MLKVFTHYSILEGFCHIDDLVKKAGKLKLPYLSITDRHTLSGAIEFLQEIEKWNKKNDHKIQPIIGCTYNVILEDGSKSEQTIVAKNKNGYMNLVAMLGRSKFVDNELFIHENDFIQDDVEFITDILTPHVYYIEESDRLYHRILLCSKYKSTMRDIINVIPNQYHLFFEDDVNFHLPDASKLKPLSFSVETYSLAGKPNIPELSKNANEDLRQLCRAGWKDRKIDILVANNPKLKEIYTNRIKYELSVFTEYNLSNYILLVKKFTDFCHEHGASVGLRGSAVGCLVSYLLGISDVDPLQPDPALPYSEEKCLLFERFLNKGRGASLPDVDIDIPISFRDKIIGWIKQEFGYDCVSNIITFNRMDGKGAIKEVFRILDPVNNSFDVANQITKNMVDTAKVQDIIEDLKEENPKYNVINYCIDNISKIKEYYQEYKDQFDIAIKMASTIVSTGKHAAGIVITNSNMKELFPVTFDEDDGSMILGFEMVDAEYAGAVKYDLLGVAAYEKIDVITKMINDKLLTVPKEIYA